ncbi:hypothetical protein NQ317_000017 [Molorchus minor]|uniref:Integrase p58-like C-terminal domain-containing protein n=1 Tax=Molorchus minor TaxID=1323400 RepID=A0ABQ9JBM2_9CUCU|nr:hypothetical protein NQ317_000017 [Molorchus minor]
MDDIHDQVRSNIQSASDRMKETYDIGAQNDGYQSGDLTLWEGPYEVLARINVVYRIKKSSGGKPRVVHFNRLTPFSGSNDASVRTVVPSTHEMSFENFMAQYSPNHKARYGVTREEQRDLFQVPAESALAHCVAQDLQMSRGIAAAFKEKFEMRGRNEQKSFLSGDKTPIPREADIRERVGITNQPKRCFIVSRGHPFGDTQVILWTGWPELAGGPNMLEVLFQFTGIEVLCNESASSVPSTALSPLTSREHDLTTFELTRGNQEMSGSSGETFDGNQEQRRRGLIPIPNQQFLNYLKALLTSPQLVPGRNTQHNGPQTQRANLYGYQRQKGDINIRTTILQLLTTHRSAKYQHNFLSLSEDRPLTSTKPYIIENRPETTRGFPHNETPTRLKAHLLINV